MMLPAGSADPAGIGCFCDPGGALNFAQPRTTVLAIWLDVWFPTSRNLFVLSLFQPAGAHTLEAKMDQTRGPGNCERRR